MNTEAETATQEAAEEKLELSVDVKETSACERHVTVTVPRTDIERYFAKQFDAEIEFSLGDDGRAETVTLYQHGNETVANRVN